MKSKNRLLILFSVLLGAAPASLQAAPSVGSPAPSFQGLDAEGRTVTLEDFRGSIVVLYFYPKDDTPGCTIEAKEFRDMEEAFRKAGARVIGVSRDDEDSHRRFARKYDLNFLLLSDPDGRIHDAYGAFKSGSIFGRSALGVDRSTFVIGPDGTLLREWRSVNPSGHAEEVLRFIESWKR